MKIKEKLLRLGEAEYADFQAKLTPTVKREACIGVRLPGLRQFAKNEMTQEEKTAFLKDLPHAFYDENILHSILLSEIKEYDRLMPLLQSFLPFVDNWAVCDTLRPRVFAKHKQELAEIIPEWIASEAAYTCRFGLETVMNHFLQDAFDPSFLLLASRVVREDYYVRMMVAWLFATSLSKRWKETIPYLENRLLPPWVHKKTIQKAIESYRITPEQKDYLRSLRKPVM